MNWRPLENLTQLDQIDDISRHQPVLIFKHSTRCSISGMALSRIESKWNEATDEKILLPWFLDLLKNRNISEVISNRYGVRHESPQVLVIKSAKCTYHASHSGISYAELFL